MKRIVLSTFECIGCGSCVDIAPAYFMMDDMGKANLFGGRAEKEAVATELFPGDDDAVQMALRSCPSKCIAIENK